MELDIFKYKDIPLYVINIPYGFNSFHREYFTRIPWGEYKRIRYAERVESLDPWSLKIKIFRDYTIRAKKYEDYEINLLPAGIVDTIANLIMYISDSGIIPDKDGNINVSGFTSRLNMYRSIASNNVEYQMYTIICLVFRAYTFEMLDKLPFDRIASLFASAERYLLENGVIKEPLQVYDPRLDKKFSAPINQSTKSKEKVEDSEDSILDQFLKLKEQMKVEPPEIPVKVQPEPIKSQPKIKTKPVVSVVNDDEEQLYYAPKDEYVVSNGVQVKVPGIIINKENKSGGFEQEDFSAPRMTDEEAMALHMEMGLFPAGYEFMIENEKIKNDEINKNNPSKPIGKKRFKNINKK